MRRPVLGLALVAGIGALAATAAADSTVRLVILAETGIGSSSQAQPYVDKLVAIAAEKNGWSSAEGKYFRSRSEAVGYINGQSPHYGIVSLGAFLGLRQAHGFEVIGAADVARAGGRRYHIVSKNQSDLGGCKGKSLATNHGGDERFVDKVVSGGDFALSDFTVVATTRPVQTIKKVASGDAECALIDDAQYDEIAHVDGAAGVKSVWQSKQLPPMPVVALPSASAAEKAKFKSTLDSLCDGDGKQVCNEVGIQGLRSASDADYAAVIAAYQ